MDNSIDTGVEYTGKYVPVAKAKVQKVADTVMPVVKAGGRGLCHDGGGSLSTRMQERRAKSRGR